jgi:hypothetical protein
MVDLIPGISNWIIVKIAILILLGLYLMFCLIVTRQVKLITSTISSGFELSITMFGYIHLAFAVFVFLAALVIL